MRLAAVRLAALLAVLLGGCTLIDQNTFNPRAGDAPVIPPAPKAVAAPVVAGPPPLLVIAPSDPAVYADALRRAVAAARARKPDVVFDVVEMQAPDATGEAALGAHAAAVARGIVGQGVAPQRVRLVARPEAGAAPGEVQVFVR